jgi:hypothetical protein
MQGKTSSSPFFEMAFKALVVTVLVYGPVSLWISHEHERAARATEQKRALNTGSFPACADKIRGSYEKEDGSQSVSEIKGDPSSMTKNGNIITGDISFSYTYYHTPDASPEQAAQAYAAGVAIGLDKEELADAAARSMSSSSSDYTRKVKYIYNAAKDSCVLNKNVIDTETGQSKPLSN